MRINLAVSTVVKHATTELAVINQLIMTENHDRDGHNNKPACQK